MKSIRYIALAGLTSIALMMSACGGSSGGGIGNVTGSLTSFYKDSNVTGVNYRTTSGVFGQTGADGSFNFNAGDNVIFSIGSLILRNQGSLTDGQIIIENNVTIATFLQSIDSDGNASNGINITDGMKAIVQTWLAGSDTIELNTTTNKIEGIGTLTAALIAGGFPDVTEVNTTEAIAHLDATIAEAGATAAPGTHFVSADGTINYVDDDNNIRKAPPSAAAAEYHTGIGYGNTLFDSADNKCQNCHNELYDTWKGSMHGKSWTDPIFQSKFQDSLRTNLAKIGEIKAIQYEQSEVGVGTENMFSSAALTCIKCHAPGAYYAGDVKVSVTEVQDATDINSSVLAALKATHEVSAPMGETAVIAANQFQNKVYKATFQIGHEANKEGINCAFCHSIETPRMMKDLDSYTLKTDMRDGDHGLIQAPAGTQLDYNADATDPGMNKFFRLWGPEKPVDYNNTNKGADDVNTRSVDGRYTMTSVDLNGTNGKTHYTGGPFYGPFGPSGKGNENADDDTNRTALLNPHYDKDNNNHFGSSGKSLCLSCHQRSAGVTVPAGEEGADQFMELCSTQMAVTTGDDTPTDDTLSSPKCQKCHMERIEGNLLHQWARPDLSFDATEFEAAAGYALTPELDVNDTTVPTGDNPQRDGWYNSHAFLGASKTGGHKASVVRKIQSGFFADVNTSIQGNTLTVNTTFTNKTAHMFPGAHPMRRVLTRLIVADENGTMLTPTSVTGTSTFGDITNSVQPVVGKILAANTASTTTNTVTVVNNLSENLSFPGKADDLNGSAVPSQRFYSDSGVGKVTVVAPDATVKSQSITSGVTKGLVFNSAIVDSNNSAKFTRIYGHETGKKYNVTTGLEEKNTGTFVVRPGFDSNMVGSDTRLSPNETETYTATYDVSGYNTTQKDAISAKYKVYYMQKGANGQFKEASDGFLDKAASDAAKFLVTEVYPALP